jgi:hypothetical protein
MGGGSHEGAVELAVSIAGGRVLRGGGRKKEGKSKKGGRLSIGLWRLGSGGAAFDRVMAMGFEMRN